MTDKLTVDEFFEKLEGLGLEWELLESGFIRCTRGCPIVAVNGKGLHSFIYGTAAEELGLNLRSADAIAEASDDRLLLTHTQRRYRKRLLKACGLA